MNILVLGPKGVGKTSFINKMFSKYGEDLKRYVIESDVPLLPDPSEVTQVYLILPDFETVSNRCDINEHQYEQWMNYYNTSVDKYTIVWVTEF